MSAEPDSFYLSREAELEQLRLMRRRIAGEVTWEQIGGGYVQIWAVESDFHILPDSEKSIVRIIASLDFAYYEEGPLSG